MVAILQRDVESVSMILRSREEDGLDGVIDRQTGDVWMITDADDELPSFWRTEGDDDYEEFETRYLRIPCQGSQDAYQDMVDFIETVEDEHLSDLLSVAVQGRGAFGRFKDVLRRSKYEPELQRWYEFEANSDYRRVEQWLAEEGIGIQTLQTA
jgi:hypothetical protein